MTTVQENTVELTQKRLASLVQLLGNPVSTILLDSSYEIFAIPDIEGLIGYQLVNSCAVVMGDPMCLEKDRQELTQAFHKYCNEKQWSIIYFLCSDSFAHWAIQNQCRTLIQVGQKLILDPIEFKIKQKLRWKVNQALQSGVEIKEYHNFDLDLEEKMKGTIKKWLETRNGMQIYLGKIDPFNSNGNKRVIYATYKDEIIGLLILSKVDLCQGWVITSFFALPSAPVGTSEHLIVETINALKNEDCHFLCLGVVAGEKIGEVRSSNFLTKFSANFIFGIARRIFSLDLRKNYFSKYDPTSYPTYLVCSSKLTFRELMALKKIVMH